MQAKEKRQGEGASVLIIIRIVVRRAKRSSAATPPSREFLSCSAPRTRAPLRWCQARKTGLGRDATIARILILFGAADTRPFALVSGAQNGARPRRHHRANSYLVWRRGHAPLCACCAKKIAALGHCRLCYIREVPAMQAIIEARKVEKS